MNETAKTQTLEMSLADGRFGDWVAYRKLLRKVPLQAGFPGTITWPTQPAIAENDSDPLWTRMYRRGNIIGTVSQGFFGIPTGAIIERGSNANGSYVRFADGLQICTKNRDSQLYNITTAAGQIFTQGAEFTRTYPIAFNTTTDMVTGADFRSGNNYWIKSRPNSDGGASFKLFSATSASPTMIVDYFAIGTWI